MTIKWGLPAADRPLLTRIIERAAAGGHVATKNRANLAMDLTACHLNGTPLDFARLVDFPELDFVHDLYGISRYLDRNTGKLTDNFLPRCALPASTTQREYADDLIQLALNTD